MAETKEEVKDTVEDATGDGDQSLAKRILIPAAAGIGTLAATYAVRKGPDLFRERVLPKLEEEGGEEAAKVGEKAADRLQGKGGMLGAVGKIAGGAGGGGREKTRRLPIQRWTDVAVPVETAYEKWTEFEEFPKFMHRVVSVEREEDDTVSWEEKIWFSKRQWKGEITDQRENDRIAWKTVQGTAHSGVVTFHRLDDNLTRIMVTVDFRPSGLIEKMASGLRFVKRAVQADLARFKAYVEMGESEGLEYTHEATTEQGDQSDEERRKGGDETENGSRASASNGRGDTAEATQRTRDEREQLRTRRAEERAQRAGRRPRKS